MESQYHLPQKEAIHKKKYQENKAILLNSGGIGVPIEDSGLEACLISI